MSDELTALQQTAEQARAKADELKAALTDASSDEDKAAAEQADTDATAAESAFSTAQAAEEAAQAGAALKAGDACVCPDGRPGTLWSDGADGFVCLPNHDQSE
jgi:hypothetical protein